MNVPFNSIQFNSIETFHIFNKILETTLKEIDLWNAIGKSGSDVLSAP